ncbi:hypothetical protein WA026_001238 [Henosepilachna vigintioctopunctata]|uniref:RING-type E3 ubiquitin transferase n=1 Tax=Henosepilachna vigintioctopunctata TaxID=420089 RepID=A0AAW1UQJ4_9CUCU
MSLTVDQNSSEYENLCILCFKNVNIYSFGICDHPVCYECSTRMRVLCRQNECPICRGDLPKVIFTDQIEPFVSLFPKYSKTDLQDAKYGLIFTTSDIQRAYEKLLENRCSVCPEEKSWNFKTFGQLKDHMRREHELFYCDICIEHVLIFSSERRTYTRQELGMHRRKGDPDNTSHRGHPLCEFCDTRFMDSDELFRHMRRMHLFCHFCDADGRHLYYKNIEDLQKHFRDEHFLCEEGDCKNVPMTAAFRTEIDLRAHIASSHGRNLGKNASKQLRTLELAFTLAPRNTSRKKPLDTRNDEEGAVGSEPGGPGGGQDSIFHNTLTPMDFPALAGSSSKVTQLKPATAFTSKLNQKLNKNDFPSLGNSNNRPTSEVRITTSRNSEVSFSKNTNNFPALGKPSTSRESRVMLSVHNNSDSKAPQVSIQLNHKPNTSFHTQIITGTFGSRSQASQKQLTEAFPALGCPSKERAHNQPQWVQVKSKKQPEKASKVNPAPQLPPTDISQFPNLSKGKTNKKTSSIQVPVSSNWVNLNSLKKESAKNTQKEKPTDTLAQEITKTTKIEDKTKKKKKGKTPSINTELSSNKTIKETAKTVQTEENVIDTVQNRKNNNNTEPLKPPPGFNVPPPPGFENHINEFPCLGLPNDLTFTTSSGQSYAITTKVNNYRQPDNFSSRNQNIIKRLSMVSTNDSVNDFKKRSEMFRNNQLSSEKYYDYCKQVLGANFEEFFPELLVLLPDIEKQQALFQVLSGKCKKNLVVCENCKQVIMKRELTEHYKYHTFENRFSSQVTTQVNNNTYSAWNK